MSEEKKEKKPRLTKTQKEALNSTPLYFGQSETNLSHFYWGSDSMEKDFQPRTITKLMEMGLLEVRKGTHNMVDHTVAYLTQKAKGLGFED